MIDSVESCRDVQETGDRLTTNCSRDHYFYKIERISMAWFSVTQDWLGLGSELGYNVQEMFGWSSALPSVRLCLIKMESLRMGP